MLAYRGFIQVAGVHDVDEALMLARCGVDAVGLPLRLPVHAEDCSEREAARIIQGVRAQYPSITAACITYEPDPREAVELARRIGASILQMHGDMNAETLACMRAAAPELFIIKSLIVGRGRLEQLLEEATAAALSVDAFITDTFDPKSGATGATGRVHDWEASRHIARAVAKPIMLAGGLHPGNVDQAIRAAEPAAVDAHTGLEGPDGLKQEALVQSFVQEARRAFAAQDPADRGTIHWPIC